MKANVTPELDAKWWSKNKPITLKKTGLGAALKNYAKARDAFHKFAKGGSADFEGHRMYMEAKRILGSEVGTCAEVGIKAASSTLHKDTIAALKKYKSVVIPAENKRLDRLFEQVSKAGAAAANKTLAEYDKLVDAWATVGENSAKMVLASRKVSATVDDMLANAAAAARTGKLTDAETAAQRAEFLRDKLAAMERSVTKDLAKAQKATVDIDPSSLDAAQKKAFNKKADKRMTSEEQTKANAVTLNAAVKAADDVLAECRKAVSGGGDLVKMYIKTMDKLVGRAFRYAQQDIDVASRECSGATANIGIAIDDHKAAKTDKERADAKDRALGFSKHAIAQHSVLKDALKRARADVKKSLDGMPRDIVNPKNSEFVKLFAELEKAIKIYDDEEKVLAKQAAKIQKLVPEAKKLA